MSIMPQDPDHKPDTPPKCASAYNVSRGLWLHCTGEHLRGNFMRGNGIVHQQRYAGVTWTWYDDEADTTNETCQRDQPYGPSECLFGPVACANCPTKAR